MNLSTTEANLVKAFEEFEIIDAHEHIPPESVRLDLKVDALTLFSCYTRTDLITAGMSEQAYERIHDPTVPLEERWNLFRPHLPNIRYGSYARPAFIAVKEFYGFDDINDGNYRALLTDNILSMASELGLAVGVHTGMWGDFRALDPKHLIPAIIRHPETKFDIYHMGMPWVRDTGIMGKNFPNVWLNLCWSHVISPRMVCSALDEWMDLVPMNKIIAFGGDYDKQIEKVYGHLVMARENIARVLGGRVDDGLMTEEEAITIAKKWFYHNPKELYDLKN